MENQATSQAQGIIEKAVASARAFRQLGQKETDRIVRAVYLAAMDQRIELGQNGS